MLSSILIQLRIENHLSREQLADRLHVSPQTIVSWETNQSNPDVDQIVLLSELFHVSTDFLLKGAVARRTIRTERNMVCFAFSATFMMLIWISAFILFIICGYTGFFSDTVTIFSTIVMVMIPILFALHVIRERKRAGQG